MQILKKGMLFLIRSRIWIGLGGMGVVIFAYRQANVELKPVTAALAFFGTWLTYFAQRWTPLFRFTLSKDESRLRFLQFWGMLYLAIVLITVGWVLRWGFSLLPFLTLISVPAFLYAVPIRIGSKSYKGVRSIPGLKSICVAFVWAALAFLPSLDQGLGFEIRYRIIAVMIFLLVYVLMIAFDVRDMHTDDAKLKTLPQVLGLKGAKYVGFALLGVSMVSAQYGLAWEDTPNRLILLWWAVHMYAGILLYQSVPGKNELFYEGLVDGALVTLCLSFVL